MKILVEILSDQTIDAIFVHYPMDDQDRIKQLLLSDNLNIQLGIEIIQQSYPNIIIEDKRYNFKWINHGFFPIDPTRTSILKLSTI